MYKFNLQYKKHKKKIIFNLFILYTYINLLYLISFLLLGKVIFHK